MIRSAAVLCLVLLGALGCGDDKSDDICPEPNQTIVGPEVAPNLSSVPVCRPADNPE